MDTETQTLLDNQSSIVRAAKKLKKPKKPKTVKKPKVKKKPKAVKKPKVKKKPKAKRSTSTKKVDRPCRLDMRLSRAEDAKINAKAKKLRRTRTSIVLEAIEKLK